MRGEGESERQTESPVRGDGGERRDPGVFTAFYYVVETKTSVDRVSRITHGTTTWRAGLIRHS